MPESRVLRAPSPVLVRRRVEHMRAFGTILLRTPPSHVGRHYPEIHSGTAQSRAHCVCGRGWLILYQDLLLWCNVPWPDAASQTQTIIVTSHESVIEEGPSLQTASQMSRARAAGPLAYLTQGIEAWESVRSQRSYLARLGKAQRSPSHGNAHAR